MRDIFKLNSITNYRIFIGNDYKQWKINTLKQVIESRCEYFVLLQEDHFLIEDILVLKNYLDQLVLKNIELGHISAWGTYSEMRQKIKGNQDSEEDIFGVYYNLDKLPWTKLRISEPKYIVPIVAFFRKELLIKLLLTHRPFWRRYHAYSPFDFEQNAKAKWILPIKIAFPQREIFACVDDDIGVPGSSLQSRGLYKLDQIRISEQHNTMSFSMQKNIPWIRNKILLGKYKNGVYLSLKSDFSKRSWVKISKIMIKTIRFYDSLIYTLHALLNYVLNIPEFVYKVKVKTNMRYN
jgi:hypothetical protein